MSKTRIHKCTKCEGKGKLRKFFGGYKECWNCDGSGKIKQIQIEVCKCGDQQNLHEKGRGPCHYINTYVETSPGYHQNVRCDCQKYIKTKEWENIDD